MHYAGELVMTPHRLLERKNMSSPKNLTPQPTERKQIPAADIERMKKRDRELVRGKFIFHEVPGGYLEFPFKKWKGDPVERYSMQDGEVYTIPFAVAVHLNQNIWYPEYTHVTDSNSKQVQRITKQVHRTAFASLEFMDYDDLKPSSIVRVENANTGLAV